MKDLEQRYATRDIGLAGFLIAHSTPMAGVQRHQDHLTFVFNLPEQCRELEKQYMTGDDNVSAKSLLSAGKHLRRLVRENL